MTESAPPPQAHPPVRPGRPPAPGPWGFARDSVLMAWRWLTRMRTALYLLGLLALLTVVATFVPQEPNVASTVRSWRDGEAGPGTGVARALDALGAFDVYGSPLFLAFLLLLYISLTACLIPRIRAWVRLVRHSRPPLLGGAGPTLLSGHFRTDRDPADVHAEVARVLAAARWRVRPHDGTGTGRLVRPPQVAAEKGLVTREGGSLLFHLSFYVLLAAIVFGQLLTFEGQRGVIEGEPGFHDTAVSYWSYSPGRWFGESDHAGWRLDLERFHVDWVRDLGSPGAGQPTEFRSDVVVTRPGGNPERAVIDSNRPLAIDDMRVTQLDWGYAPRVVVTVDGELVHDGFVLPVLADGGAYRGAVKAPAADPDLGLELFLYPFAPDGQDGRPIPTGAPWDDEPLLLFRQWRGDLQLGATQQTVNELDTTALTSEGGAFLRLGQEVDMGNGVTVAFPELRRWVGYQVSSRPLIPALLAAAVLLVGGLLASLYAYRRRLWVVAERDPGSGRTLVRVAGRAFQRPEAFVDEHARILATLAEATGATPDRAAAGADAATDLAGGPESASDRAPRSTPGPEVDPEPEVRRR